MAFQGQYVPQFQPQASSEQDLTQLIRVMDVNNDSRFHNVERQNQELAQQNSALRNQLGEVLGEVGNMKGQLAGFVQGLQSQDPYNSPDWARSYGGNPQQQAPQAQSPQQPAINPKDLDALLDQREQARAQARAQAEAQRRADGERLYKRFSAEHPSLAQDPVFTARLARYWEDAEAMNSRADQKNQLSRDQLYQYAVSRMIQVYNEERSIQAQIEQQHAQQNRGLFEGPNAVRRPNGTNGYPQGQPTHPNQPPSPYGQQYQDHDTGQQMSGAQRIAKDPIRLPYGSPGATGGGGGSMYNAPSNDQQAQSLFGGDAAYQQRMMDRQARLSRGPIPGFQ